MPFTPLHLSLPLFIYAITNTTKQHNKINKITWLSITIGSIAPDIQAFLSLFTPKIKMHGFSHTIIGAVTYSLVYYAILLIFLKKRPINNLNPEKQALLFLLSIIFFHLLPDAIIYSDMHVFWPISNKSYASPQNYYYVSKVLIFIALFSLIVIILTKSIEKINVK